MVLLEISVLALVIALVLFIAGKYSTAGKKGSVMDRLVRKHPRYFNLEKGTAGRIAGQQAIERIDAEKCRIRYKKGLMNFEVDEDIPLWAVVTLNPPECDLPEGFVIVRPYSENNKLIGDTDIYLKEIYSLRRKAKGLERVLLILEAEFREKDITSIAFDAMKKMSLLINEIKTKTEGLKQKTEEVSTIKLDTKQTSGLKPL